MTIQRTIKNRLRPLGIVHTSKGYHRVVTCIQLAVENENRLEAITKEIYMEAADLCECDWRCIERNIRIVVKRAWDVNRPLLEDIAGYPLDKQPSAGEFLELITNNILRDEEAAK